MVGVYGHVEIAMIPCLSANEGVYTPATANPIPHSQLLEAVQGSEYVGHQHDSTLGREPAHPQHRARSGSCEDVVCVIRMNLGRAAEDD